MPRLSLWKPQKSDDYRYFDRTIKEQFQVGGTDLLVHKYLGPANTGPSDDFTQPQVEVPVATAIQDLLYVENRDRVYDSSVFRIRGHYNVQNLDFDLSQFGLFLSNDTIFITVHYNTMIDLFGRKLMVGDVLELPHLTDYHPLNDALPVSLRRFYQITDANFASEGFSQTWFPHLWRIKCEPLVNSQEFQNILNVPIQTDNYMGNYDPNQEYQPGYTVSYGDKIYTPIQVVPPGTNPPNPEYWREDTTAETLGSVISTYKKNIEINDKIIEEAARVVPKSGYDVSPLYLVPTQIDNTPAPPVNIITSSAVNGPMLGTLNSVSNPNYKNSSTVIKLSNPSITAGLRVILNTGITGVGRTDTGSGRVSGDTVLLATVGPSTGPYGTADNTFITSDQFVRSYVTGGKISMGAVQIPVTQWSDDLVAGILVRGTVFSPNGTAYKVFPDDTRIVSVDKVRMRFTVNNGTLVNVPAGLRLEIAYDFSGTVTPELDYRADCDPRYQFIRRASPRDFGYINGYLTGDGQAPNGEPCGSGVVFPADPLKGDYFLRIDYLPQKLFRWDGVAWREISRNVRTGKGLAQDSENQLASFVNNRDTLTLSDGTVIPSRQALSNVVSLKPD